MFLYSEVRRRRPATLLEFGSGESTVFIAEALRENGHGHLWSCEDQPRWLEHTQHRLSPELAPWVTLVHSRMILTEDYGAPAYRYKDVPDLQYDFVFLDGPDPAIRPGVDATCNLLGLSLGRRLAHGAWGMIDGRIDSVLLTKQLGARVLKFRYRPSLRSYTFEKR